MLKQTKVFRNNDTAGERILDSNTLERERGITILAKNTAVMWGDVKVNIVDTPGHADFGGEVERVLNMVDGALLLIDAVEGPMPQTRFVLRKALAAGLTIIVVINKVDRPHANPEVALNETFDLFIELGANDEQANFPVVYAIGMDGRAGYQADTLEDGLKPLFDTILNKIPPPEINAEEPARMLITNIEYDNYKGQIGIGRINSGIVKKGMPVVRITPTGERVNAHIDYLFTFYNLSKVEATEVRAGDIIAIGGLGELGISDTIADPANAVALPPILVEEPTVRMTFGVNTSPVAGREGKTGLGTSRRLRERLMNETRSNLALRVGDGESPERFVVSGRGELHLGILIETMRREGYEFEVSKPEVIYRRDPETGEMLEPVEEVHVDVADDLTGVVVEMLGARRGQMIDIRSENGTTYVKYIVPTRGLLGFRAKLLTATSGMGTIHSIFHSYEPVAGAIPGRQFGSLIAYEAGPSTTYAMADLQQRGTFIIEPGTEVYTGMVVGEHIRPEDLAINVCKSKHLTAVRTKNYADDIRLRSIRTMSLDDYIEFMAEDELLEVTPASLRLRKRILNNELRMRDVKAREKFMADA